MTNMTAIYAALLGALAAAVAQLLTGRRRLHLRREATMRAIAAEVGVLTELLRIQYRPDGLTEYGRRIAADPKTAVFPPDPSLGYFTVYEGLSGQLGMIEANRAASIVEFYTFYKVAIGLASQANRDTAMDEALLDLLFSLSERATGSGADLDPPSRGN